MKQILIGGHNPNRIYFTNRTGKKVYANVEDPQMYLDMRQKELHFMGHYRFLVPQSTINDLEKLINWHEN